MPARYPAQIDNSVSLPTAVDGFTPVQGSIFNKLRDSVVAIEHELGVKPSGSYSTVRARLDALEGIVGNLKIIELDQDLGGTLKLPKVIGIQGRPVSDAEPNFLDVLAWDGIAWVPSVQSGSGGSSSTEIGFVHSTGTTSLPFFDYRPDGEDFVGATVTDPLSYFGTSKFALQGGTSCKLVYTGPNCNAMITSSISLQTSFESGTSMYGIAKNEDLIGTVDNATIISSGVQYSAINAYITISITTQRYVSLASGDTIEPVFGNEDFAGNALAYTMSIQIIS